MHGARYLRKILLTAFLVIALHFGILLSVRTLIPAEYWIREFEIVKRFQISTLPSPKIVFVGGSATLFGIDASQVGKALGLPAFNYGLMAGLHLEDLLACGGRDLNPGDILVLSLEPPYYGTQGDDWSAWRLRNALAWNHAAFDRLSFLEKLITCARFSTPDLDFDLLQGFLLPKLDPKALRRRREAMAPEAEILARYHSPPGPSRPFSFEIFCLDPRGDALRADGKSGSLSAFITPDLPGSIGPKPARVLATFIHALQARRITVYVDYTPYHVETPPLINWRPAEAAFRKDIRALGSEVLEPRDQFFYPRRLLFDNELHLNTRGRAARTSALIEALRPKIQALKIPSSPAP